MKITCANCYSNFAVPDEKLPKGKKVNLRCPKCTSVIVVGEDPPRQQEQPVNPVTTDSGHKGQEDGLDLALLEQEGRLALGMPLDAGVGHQIKAGVEALGYRYVDVLNTDEAID